MKRGTNPSGHPQQHGAAARIALAVIALLVLIAVGWNWYQRHLAPPVIVATAPPAVAPTDGTPPPDASASEPGVRYPVEGAASGPAASASAPSPDLTRAISALVDSRAGRSMLQLADFPRRFVATVDNLGRAHAPPLVWPLNPAPGRFTTVRRNQDTTVIAPSNRERYDTLVQLIEAIDVAKAAALYRSIYPQLQEAYRQLGFPDAYFNDRFVEVIDKMLATPEVDAPVEVRLTEVKGPLESTRPWVRYEFADPQLEQLSAGQKILLRVGPEHRRRLMAKLVAVRAALTNPIGLKS